jgi:hypothetical protein
MPLLLLLSSLLLELRGSVAPAEDNSGRTSCLVQASKPDRRASKAGSDCNATAFAELVPSAAV